MYYVQYFQYVKCSECMFCPQGCPTKRESQRRRRRILPSVALNSYLNSVPDSIGAAYLRNWSPRPFPCSSTGERPCISELTFRSYFSLETPPKLLSQTYTCVCILSSFRVVMMMFTYRDEVIRALEEKSVLVIAGDTGCGKSTQVSPRLIYFLWSS